jgi:hypothetical protein
MKIKDWLNNFFVKQEKNKKILNVNELKNGIDVIVKTKDPTKIFSPHPPLRWNLSSEENSTKTVKGTITKVLKEKNVIGFELSSINRTTFFFTDEIELIFERE